MHFRVLRLILTKSKRIMYLWSVHIRPQANCNHCPNKAGAKMKTLWSERTGNYIQGCSVFQQALSYTKRLQKLHTVKMPYPCKVCSKALTTASALQRHERIHTGEKPYTCKVCSKGFSKADHLKHHKMIHTGEKPYTC